MNRDNDDVEFDDDLIEESANERRGASPSSKKTRSPLERVVVWGLIIVLIGTATNEFLARKSYEKTLAALDEVSWDDNPTLETVLSSAQGWYRQERIKGELIERGAFKFQEDHVQLTWVAIQTYVIRLSMDGEVVEGFETGNAPEDESMNKIEMPDKVAPPPDFAPTGMSAGPGD